MIEIFLHRNGSLGLFGLFTLKKGSNKVPKELWEKAKESKVTQAYLKMGMRNGLVEGKDLSEGKPQKNKTSGEPKKSKPKNVEK